MTGPRKGMSVLDGTYGEVYLDKVITDNDQYEMLGSECDLNGIASPYTYVAKEQTYAFCSPAVNLYKDILRQNPEMMLEIREEAKATLQTL